MSAACRACGHDNRAEARFCARCGGSLVAVCPSCARPSEVGDLFCVGCGASLDTAVTAVTTLIANPPASRPVEGERKQVTVLFADVVRSMDLAERLDPDELSQVMTGLVEVCRDAVEAFGGTIDKFTGDGVMVLFGAPVAQEDHARRACHAALRLVEAAQGYFLTLRQRDIELSIRIGLNSGEVVAGSVGGGSYTAVGHTVGLAQRMESLASPGTPYLTEHTAALVADGFVLRGLGKTTVKGSTAPVGVFALEGASGGSAAGGRGPSGSARLVGRDSELVTVAAALTRAQNGHFQVLGIVGEAGAGKSRLCEELAHLATERGVTVGRTSGVSHAQSVPLLPILGLLRDYFGIGADDSAAVVREKIATRLLGLDPELEPELGLIFDFLEVPDLARPSPQLGPEARRRRVLETFARVTRIRSEHQTVMFLLEDLHWFDDHSVTFLNAWLATFPSTHTLVVTNFRPEFHAPWVAHSYYHQMPLAPLDGAAAGELLTDLLGPDAGMTPLADQLRTRAGGNPFFTEELVRGLAADGTLTGEPGAYALARPAHEIRVPPTVQAVLAARIDRLTAAEKNTLQAAAVIGRTFTETILAAATAADPAQLAPTLQALHTAELLQSAGERGEYRFWHPLTQEVAYGTLLGATRRGYHSAVAAALIGSAPDRLDELAPLIATHFEAAGNDLETARWQLRAAARSSVTDWAESARRLRSAIDHLDAAESTPDSVTLRVRASSSLLRVGGFTGMDRTEQDRILAEARAGADRLHDPALYAWLAASDGVLRAFSGDPAGGRASFVECGRQAEAAAIGDLRAWADTATAVCLSFTGPLPEGLALADRCIAAYQDDPTHVLEQTGYSVHDVAQSVRTILATPAGPLDQARTGLHLAAALFTERPVATWGPWALARYAHLAEFTGEPSDLSQAAGVIEGALRMSEDAGSTATLVSVLEGAGIVTLLQGRPSEALGTFSSALATLRSRGTGAQAESGLLAHSARARWALADPTAARAAADEAVAVARRHGAAVDECFGHLVRAGMYRQTATCDADLAEARAAVDAGDALAAATGADTYAAFLAEERARLDDDPSALKVCADGYDAIGATGHARRLREELAS